MTFTFHVIYFCKTNIKSVGHTKVRCKEPIVEEEGAGGAGGYGGDYGGGGELEIAADAGDYDAGDAAAECIAPDAGGDDSWGTGGGGDTAGW